MSHTYYDKDYNRDVINQYQRLEQRNKIGLPTSKIREKKGQDQEKIDSKAREFFEEKIKMKNEENHKVEKSPTNAFGKIRFVNFPASKPAQYVRLSNDTHMQNVKELVEDVWGIGRLKHKRKPNLVISVIGGAKNINLHGKKREAIKEAILAAAQPTNAWLVTDGINIGCSKLVGEIVKEGQFYIKDKDRSLVKMTRGLKAIGICSWGFIANNDALENKDKTNNDYKTYTCLSRKDGNKPSLEPNHTHFLIVDNGTNQKSQKMSQEVTKLFYNDFLKLLTANTSKNSDELGGLDIPVITLLIEGGATSIGKLHDSLDIKIPCVIMEGSGRAADIVAYALNNKFAKTKDTTDQEIKKMIHESFKEGKKIQTGERIYLG